MAHRLALAVLFGEDFVRNADEGLIRSIERNPSRWASLLESMHALQYQLAGSGEGEVPLRAHLQAEDASVPTVTRAALAGSEQTVSIGHLGGLPERVDSREEADRSLDNEDAPRGSHADVGPDALVAIYEPTAGEESQVAPPASRAEVKERLVRTLVELTEYPPTVFDEAVDLETDIGLDSIKLMQALASIRESSGLELEPDFVASDYTTVGKIVDYTWARLQR